MGNYPRAGDQLTIRGSNGRETTTTVVREQTQISVDGETCLRCDWNLEGHHLHGSWRGRGGDTSWTLRHSGHFVSHAGEGRYTLGTGGVALAFAGRCTVEHSLYCTLAPDSGRPETLWVGGVACDLC